MALQVQVKLGVEHVQCQAPALRAALSTALPQGAQPAFQPFALKKPAPPCIAQSTLLIRLASPHSPDLFFPYTIELGLLLLITGIYHLSCLALHLILVFFNS